MDAETFKKKFSEGTKGEQSAVLDEMVKVYLEKNGGVITRQEQGGVLTYWEHDHNTGNLKKIL